MSSLYKGLPANQCADASVKTAGFFAELPARAIGLVRDAFVLLTQWQKRHNERRQLSRLDSRLLDDMGVTQVERDLEVMKPFWKA